MGMSDNVWPLSAGDWCADWRSGSAGTLGCPSLLGCAAVVAAGEETC